MLRWVLSAIIVYAVVAWASVSINATNEELDLKVEELAQCRASLSAAEKRVSALRGDRDLALRRAEESWQSMKSAHAEQMDKTFELIRAKDTIKVLKAESVKKAEVAPIVAPAPEAEPLVASVAKPKVQTPRKKPKTKVVQRPAAPALDAPCPQNVGGSSTFRPYPFECLWEW